MKVGLGEQPKMLRRGKHKRATLVYAVEFLEQEQGIGLFLGLFAFRDFLAQRAGMLAVERLGQSFGEGSRLRVTDDHADPGDRLQQCPVQANGQGERHNNAKSGNPQHYEVMVAPSNLLSNSCRSRNSATRERKFSLLNPLKCW